MKCFVALLKLRPHCPELKARNDSVSESSQEDQPRPCMWPPSAKSIERPQDGSEYRSPPTNADDNSFEYDRSECAQQKGQETRHRGPLDLRLRDIKWTQAAAESPRASRASRLR